MMRFISIWGFKKGKRKGRFTKMEPSQWIFGQRLLCLSNECAAVLNMVVTCIRLPECNEGRMFDRFATANHRYFNNLEEMPVFTSRNFYSVCTAICTTKSYVAKRARSILCGY